MTPARAEPGLPAPFPSGPYRVRPEWIDHNGHLNLAYYVMLFDWATDAAFEPIGLGLSYRDAGFGTFAAETHTLYRAELVEGEAVTIATQVLGCDEKRLHLAHEMQREDGLVAAQQELMYLSVSLASRRVSPWPEAVRDRLARAVADHAGLAAPAWAGRAVAMRGGSGPGTRAAAPG